MQRIDLRKDRALAFLVGLLYGYRNVQMELKIHPFEDFSEDKHAEDRVYYLNRRDGKIYQSFQESTTHICVLREDKINHKVYVFVYKQSCLQKEDNSHS